MILLVIKHKVTVKNTIHLELIIQCFPLQVHLVAVLVPTTSVSAVIELVMPGHSRGD